MASVSAADVRDALNLTPTDIPDSKVLKMIKRAEVTLKLELEKQIDYASCTDAEKEGITMLAAIYAICYLSGGTAISMNFSIGDQYINVLTKAPSLHVLKRQLDKNLSQSKACTVLKRKKGGNRCLFLSIRVYILRLLITDLKVLPQHS